MCDKQKLPELTPVDCDLLTGKIQDWLDEYFNKVYTGVEINNWDLLNPYQYHIQFTVEEIVSESIYEGFICCTFSIQGATVCDFKVEDSGCVFKEKKSSNLEDKNYKVITNDLHILRIVAKNAKQAVHMYWMSVSDEEALEAENVTVDTVDYFEPEYNEKEDIAIVRMDEVFAIATKE